MLPTSIVEHIAANRRKKDPFNTFYCTGQEEKDIL